METKPEINPSTLKILQSMAVNSAVEICGIVSVSGKIYPVDNKAVDKANSFTFCRVGYFKALKAACSDGGVLFIYHSHPSGYTTPSREDLLFAKTNKHHSVIITKNSYRWI